MAGKKVFFCSFSLESGNLAVINYFSTIHPHLPILKYLSQTSISYVTVERVRTAIGAFPR